MKEASPWQTERVERISEPAFKTVVVVGRPGRYDWSRKSRPLESCIIGRWTGDPISYSNLEEVLDDLTAKRLITEIDRVQYSKAIRRIDRRRGDTASLKCIRSLAKKLGMSIILRSHEDPPYYKPRVYSLKPWY